MEITSSNVKALRDATGISIMQCKKALEEAEGDMEKAKVILKRKGSEAAAKKSDRDLGSGVIGSYVHNTYEVGAFVMLSCETDFVAKNEEFVALARDIAMHVAAQDPQYLNREDIDEAALANAKAVLEKEVADKPADMQEKILQGKLDSYFKDQVLMEQPFIKNPEQTIGNLVEGAVQKFGENIAVAKMYRMSVK